jgi:hypothetical protein
VILTLQLTLVPKMLQYSQAQAHQFICQAQAIHHTLQIPMEEYGYEAGLSVLECISTRPPCIELPSIVE